MSSALTPRDATDYTTLDGWELIRLLKDDAAKWAAAFRQHAIKLGYSDMDEGWLIGWFANAIEVSNSNFPKNEREWWAHHEIARLRASNKQLREALEKAREKLKIECGQEYKGGMPTQFLYPLIDAALKDGDKT